MGLQGGGGMLSAGQHADMGCIYGTTQLAMYKHGRSSRHSRTNQCFNMVSLRHVNLRSVPAQ